MSRLITDLRQDLPQAFDTDSYRETISRVQDEFEQQRGTLLQALQQKRPSKVLALCKRLLVSPLCRCTMGSR